MYSYLLISYPLWIYIIYNIKFTLKIFSFTQFIWILIFCFIPKLNHHFCSVSIIKYAFECLRAISSFYYNFIPKAIVPKDIFYSILFYVHLFVIVTLFLAHLFVITFCRIIHIGLRARCYYPLFMRHTWFHDLFHCEVDQKIAALDKIAEFVRFSTC